ncbi:MAG: hypothetical protein J5950_10700 [Clostridia bacterium]|nr:hypothetical protein [Clostridia bacterium]
MKTSKRKPVIIVLSISLTLIILLGGCKGNKNDPPVPTDDEPISNEIPTQEPIVMRDISEDTNLGDSLLYANSVANSITARYYDGTRGAFEVINRDVRIIESNDTDGKLGIKSVSNRSGGTYFTDSMNMYVVDADGKIWQDNYSSSVGRSNTTRHGYYYWEVFQRDQEFGTAEGGSYNFANSFQLSNYKNDWASSADCYVSTDGKSAKMTLNGGLDPYVYKVLDAPIPKDQAEYIAVTIKADGAGGQSQLFIADKKTGDFNAKQCIHFNITGDGKPHTYVIDITRILTADLTAVRFDSGRKAGEVYEFSDLRAVTLGKGINAKSERTLDVYPDKVHQSFRLLARPGYEAVSEFGMIWEMDEANVEAVRIRDVEGIHEDLNFDPGTVEYAAFKVKDAGVIGIIIPGDSSTAKTTVTLENGKYTVRQIAGGKLDLKSGASCYFGHRLFTDASGSFDAIDNAARIERNPLPASSFTINEGSAGSKMRGYEPLKGYYRVTMNGTTFPAAFQRPGNNKYYASAISANCDDNDRTIYFCMRSTPGTLECAALLDDKGVMVPMPMQVCKNFDCEKEEPIYDPQDVSFGDSIFPLVMKAGSTTTFTDLHLYMNWGKYHLKQLSSIQFYIGYYHLSTGVSESNCISFYGVFGKDGFLLPDFRGHSGIMWNTDPQYTSVGTPKATSYYDNSGNIVMSEYTGAKINSSGPIYADVEYSYISDCGSFKYTLRHTEFPQTDENRTYYTLDLTFLKDLTLNDVKNQLTLLEQDSRGQKFCELSYRDVNGQRAHADLDISKSRSVKLYTLNQDNGWYAYYHSDKPVPAGPIETEDDPMNYAVIIKGADIVIGGTQWKGNFILRDSFEGGNNFSALSLDLGKTTFKKGDTIHLEFLMLPWANRDLASDSNILMVYEDSVQKPLTVKSVKTGSVVEEPYLARVYAKDETAEFTLTGGRNRNAVRVDGFTTFGRPLIEVLKPDGTWEKHETAVKEYDGYGIFYNRDGSYGYAFIYESDDPSAEVTFRVSVEKAGN